MTIKSNIRATESGSFFEQRAGVASLRQEYRFHQPIKLVPINKETIPIVQNIVSKMHTSINECGVGLAHNQSQYENDIFNLSIFIIECINQNVPPEAFINAVIAGVPDKDSTVTFPHGCLSAIGVNRSYMATYSEILIAYYPPDLNGIIVKKFDNFGAVITQHELSHILTSMSYADLIYDYFGGDETKIADYQAKSDAFYAEQQIRKKTLLEDGIYTGLILDKSEPYMIKLIQDDVLERCKNFISTHKEYETAILNYLKDHPADEVLYENLMQHNNTNEPLYAYMGETLSKPEETL